MPSLSKTIPNDISARIYYHSMFRAYPFLDIIANPRENFRVLLGLFVFVYKYFLKFVLIVKM